MVLKIIGIHQKTEYALSCTWVKAKWSYHLRHIFSIKWLHCFPIATHPFSEIDALTQRISCTYKTKYSPENYKVFISLKMYEISPLVVIFCDGLWFKIFCASKGIAWKKGTVFKSLNNNTLFLYVCFYSLSKLSNPWYIRLWKLCLYYLLLSFNRPLMFYHCLSHGYHKRPITTF